MKRFAEAYFRLLKVLIVLCLAVMVVLVFTNVMLRYTINSGISVSEEVSRWLFVYLTFLGSIIALREQEHLGTDILVARLPAAGKKICQFAAHLLMLLVTGFLLVGSWIQVQINLESTAPATGLSLGWLYGVGLLFSVSTGLILIGDIFRIVTCREPACAPIHEEAYS